MRDTIIDSIIRKIREDHPFLWHVVTRRIEDGRSPDAFADVVVSRFKLIESVARLPGLT